MSVEQVITLICDPEKDDYVAKAAPAIRKEGRCLKDEMPCLLNRAILNRKNLRSRPSRMSFKGENEISSQVLDSDIL